MLSTILLQAVEPAAQASQQEMSLMQLALAGGWIMIPLALLLILAVYIIIERYVVLRRASQEDTSFMNRIKDYIFEGKVESAINLCKQTDTPSARMIEKGISRLGRPMNDVLVAIENVGNLEVGKLENGLGLLATIAGGGPMIGFFGTVIGMVQAFSEVASNGNTIALDQLAGGIYTAMVTTVAGLFVGIVAYFGYNYLVMRVDKIMHNLEARNVEFLDMLNEPAAK
ncbi:MAG: MotA/TolQ/ExbB proton channel family protein [Paludibacteraceae bacterium]|nr:MotA/TolQ/ExbB proton channel family protein [Paludibacteraceae bacterium]MBP5135796.1 MotA/TolQ/ExbB proton channel family protein [Paludibacteraceae bacterium]MBP5742379.1 MotA/TolQ/ExbB proton channel family protein [Paludibacteraceae bacterium]